MLFMQLFILWINDCLFSLNRITFLWHYEVFLVSVCYVGKSWSIMISQIIHTLFARVIYPTIMSVNKSSVSILSMLFFEWYTAFVYSLTMLYFGFSSNMLHLLETKSCHLYWKLFILLFIININLVKLQLSNYS